MKYVYVTFGTTLARKMHVLGEESVLAPHLLIQIQVLA
jgi:hypothetical protein